MIRNIKCPICGKEHGYSTGHAPCFPTQVSCAKCGVKLVSRGNLVSLFLDANGLLVRDVAGPVIETLPAQMIQLADGSNNVSA